jgi:hypothetical protein
MAGVSVSEDQALFFRATRGHLAGPGASSVTEAARSIIGAQSQQLQPSLLALSMRTANRPTAAEVRSAIFGQSRTLVRTWGQRDTIHLYDAETHWRHVVAANQLWSPGGRGGQVPADKAVHRALSNINNIGGTATRSDLEQATPASYVRAIKERAEMASLDPKRFAAGRILWRLAHLGHVSIAERIGAEQGYVSREAWFDHLHWPEVDPEHATVQLTRDYLRVYGPATAHDIAHFFGARVTDARRWLSVLDDELETVVCADRPNLVILSDDLRQLRRRRPSARDWPVRLLPLWESMLMGHADKSWTVPIQSERKQVWRKSAMVASVVLDRGRVVATWTQKATRKKLKIRIEPLSGWRKTKHQKGAVREAESLAAHLEVPEVEVHVE